MVFICFLASRGEQGRLETQSGGDCWDWTAGKQFPILPNLPKHNPWDLPSAAIHVDVMQEGWRAATRQREMCSRDLLFSSRSMTSLLQAHLPHVQLGHGRQLSAHFSSSLLFIAGATMSQLWAPELRFRGNEESPWHSLVRTDVPGCGFGTSPDRGQWWSPKSPSLLSNFPMFKVSCTNMKLPSDSPQCPEQLYL